MSAYRLTAGEDGDWRRCGPPGPTPTVATTSAASVPARTASGSTATGTGTRPSSGTTPYRCGLPPTSSSAPRRRSSARTQSSPRRAHLRHRHRRVGRAARQRRRHCLHLVGDRQRVERDRVGLDGRGRSLRPRRPVGRHLPAGLPHRRWRPRLRVLGRGGDPRVRHRDRRRGRCHGRGAQRELARRRRHRHGRSRPVDGQCDGCRLRQGRERLACGVVGGRPRGRLLRSRRPARRHLPHRVRGLLRRTGHRVLERQDDGGARRRRRGQPRRHYGRQGRDPRARRG